MSVRSDVRQYIDEALKPRLESGSATPEVVVALETVIAELEAILEG
jgi:phage gp46-like protein